MHDFVEGEIRGFVKERLRNKAIRTRWDEPLVACADAKDPLFDELKKAVSPSHALPGDLLTGARTVIVYFMPFGRDIARSNRKGYHASEEWAVAYVETNRLIVDLNRHLTTVLGDRGYRSADLPPTHNFDKVRLMSDWSHRHVAYIAGLGTFGTHNLLITERGCCGRIGSLVTDAAIEPTRRPEEEFCLYKYNGTCLRCVKQCVTGALREDAFDRHKCYALLLENAEIYKHEGLADVCGKCTTVVPCSFTNPVRKLRERENKE